MTIPDSGSTTLLVMLGQLVSAASIDRTTDVLTGDAWRARAARALRDETGADDCCALLMIDLDRFKSVNDVYGHLVGDRVLSASAEAIRAEVRVRDLVGRLGGDEFAVLMSHTDHASAAAAAERIRSRVAGLRITVETPHGPARVSGLTVSIGGALGRGPDLTALLWDADAALYDAKRDGRNRCSIR